MNTKSIFRPEALNAHQTKWMGEVILIRPLSFTFLTLLSVAFALVIIGFTVLGTYTKRSTLTGQLVPNTGLVRLRAVQPGLIIKKLITEGQQVHQGEVLFVLSGERQSATQQNVQAAIGKQVAMQIESLGEEHGKTQIIQHADRIALQHKISGLQDELGSIKATIEIQKNRIRLIEDSVQRSQKLLDIGYISKEQAQQKQGELLEQSVRMQSLERDLYNVDRELKSQLAEFSNLRLKQQNQLGQINRNIDALKQEFTENEAKRQWLITAPKSGVITAISAEPGQNVDTDGSLASIIPSGAAMQAHLYAPGKTIGFIKPTDQVLIRFQGYPYQKFGHAKGTVSSISQTTLSAREANNELGGQRVAENIPLYRITVELQKQTIKAYGKQHSLQVGMLLDADVLQEKRYIYEWVLEPLYSRTGKL